MKIEVVLKNGQKQNYIITGEMAADFKKLSELYPDGIPEKKFFIWSNDYGINKPMFVKTK